MNEKIYTETAVALRDRFLSGNISAQEIVRGFFDRIERMEPSVNAFITLMKEAALQRGAYLDKKRSRGDRMGCLAAVPVALKDNICTRDVRTTCASRMLRDFEPPYNAHVVEKLIEADAVIIGKTNMDEFAMGSSTENSGMKITCNPWDTGCVPGGSSGGSAAAVAARMTPLALGSDTAGSVRQPAAFCGVMGLKPTYGRVSRYGAVAFASSMDQIGPISHNARDMALIMNVICAPDSLDSTCTCREAPDYLKALETPVKGLKFGLPKEFFETDGLSSDVRNALEEARKTFERLGAGFREVSLPHSRIDVQDGRLSSYAVAAYYVLCTAEAASNLARFDGVRYGLRSERAGNLAEMYSMSRSEGFGDEVKRRIMLGTHVLSSGYYDAYYLKAGRVRRLIAADMERALEKVDMIFAPTTPSTAFRIGSKVDDPLEMYLNDVFTSSCNLAGNCAVSIPCGMSPEGLPVGLQILGRKWDEAGLLAAANAYQQDTGWHAGMPR